MKKITSEQFIALGVRQNKPHPNRMAVEALKLGEGLKFHKKEFGISSLRTICSYVGKAQNKFFSTKERGDYNYVLRTK